MINIVEIVFWGLVVALAIIILVQLLRRPRRRP